MPTGVYTARKKDGTLYYRSNITYHAKHISLGSFQTEETARTAYKEARAILYENSISIADFPLSLFSLSFEKIIALLNYRDNGIYFCNPIYLHKKYFSYYLTPDIELKFDIDDLFYYSNHKIQKRQGHLFVNDYGMQYSILSRYGIKPYAVAGRDYFFSNGDTADFRYSNIINVNRYHGVFSYKKHGKTFYKTLIHINGNYKVGTYSSEKTAAIAYNKAADLAKSAGIQKQFPENYVDSLSAKEYADIYTHLKLSKKYELYLKKIKHSHDSQQKLT